MGIGSLFLTLYMLKGEWRGDPGQKLDFVGCFLYAASILSLVYGASRVPDVTGIALTPVGLLLLAIFIMHQQRARFPVFEVKLFVENKRFAFSSFAALLNYSATFSVTFLLSLYLQYIKGMTPQTAGTILMAQPVIMAIFSPAAGRLADRMEPRYLATAGMAITVLGVLLFRMLDGESSVVAIIGNLILLGFGFALFSSPNMSAIMGSVEKRYYGLASGAVATMRLLGQMASMAVAMVVLTLMVGRQQIEPSNYDQFLAAIHIVFAISALSCLVGVYFSWFRGEEKVGSPGQGPSTTA
jgi:MFS family permease